MPRLHGGKDGEDKRYDALSEEGGMATDVDTLDTAEVRRCTKLLADLMKDLEIKRVTAIVRGHQMSVDNCTPVSPPLRLSSRVVACELAMACLCGVAPLRWSLPRGPPRQD